jgi:hypothetical protein
MEVLTKDAVCSETGFERPASVGRKCVCVGEEPRQGRVGERPRYESDTAPFIPVRADGHGGYLLFMDKPGEKDTNVETLLSQCFSTCL